MLSDYLLAHHKDDLINILQDEDDSKHFSINIKLDRLLQEDSAIANKLLKEFESLVDENRDSIILAQQDIINQCDTENFVIKNNVHIRLFNFPPCPELVKTTLPKNQDVGMFLEISGTIIRTTIPKLLEFKRNYECSKCKQTITVKADFERRYLITPPTKCTNSECNGFKFIATSSIDRTNSKDYQEVKLQEQVSQASIGLIPDSVWVILEDDLVDLCKPGDNVAVCGTVKRRWKIPAVGKKMEVEIVIKANHVFVNNDVSSITTITPEMKEYFSLFWKKNKSNPLKGRDAIVKSFCPEIYGLFLIKLALMVTLAGGSQFKDINDTKIKTRSEPHLLLVGDPGTGKSQLLKYAVRVISRSVFTTGIGSTSAGLTVTAVNENGEWQLEAGALVLSDGGVCCIDEFNSMKEHDRTSIHEAMEQQTLSIAKASIVCKLNTRCSILAATNPKGNLDPLQNFNANIGLASPLLSRFDLVFIIKDAINTKWDSLIADFILNDFVESDKHVSSWDLQMLQAYFIHIKKINPMLTNDTNKILGTYYQFQRKAISRNRARTTVRLLDSLVRLSQAHARLMCHTEVEIVDAITAVMLIETSMQGDSSILGLDFDIYDVASDDPLNSYIQLIRSVLTKLQLFDLLEKELYNIKEKASLQESNVDSSEIDETTLQTSFKSVFKRHNSTVKNVVISKRKNCSSISDNSKKIKLISSYKDSQDNVSSAWESSNSDSILNSDCDSSELNIVSQEVNDVNSVISQSTTKVKFQSSVDDNEIDGILDFSIQESPKRASSGSNSFIIKSSRMLFKDYGNVSGRDTEDIFSVNEADSLIKENSSAHEKLPENKLELNLSQKTRNRSFLSKFRFKPRDTDQQLTTSIIDNTTDDSVQYKEENTDTVMPVDNNGSAKDKTTNNLTQNTRNRLFINNFRFNTKAQIKGRVNFSSTSTQYSQPSKIYSQSIFEQQEDCENLDLDL